MKAVTAEAAYSKRAKALISNRDSARKVFKGIIEVRSGRDGSKGSFVVGGTKFSTFKPKK